MDNLSLKIVRCLQWPQGGLASRPTYWEIAKKLQVSPKSVRIRLDSLYSTGVIKHLRLTITPAALGLEETIVPVQCTDAFQKKIAEKIELFDFLETVHMIQPLPQPNLVKYGFLVTSSSQDRVTNLHILHIGEDDLDRKLRLLKEICGDFTVMQKLRTRSPVLDRQHLLRDFELRMIEIMRHDPLIKVAKLAKKLRVTRGKVTKRIQELASGGVFQLEPVLNTIQIRDSLFAVMIVAFDETNRSRVDPILDATLNGNYFAVFRVVKGSSSYFCSFATPLELSETQKKLNQIGCVNDVAMVYSSDTLDNSTGIPLNTLKLYRT